VVLVLVFGLSARLAAVQDRKGFATAKRLFKRKADPVDVRKIGPSEGLAWSRLK
jgi:hypothetical protein